MSAAQRFPSSVAGPVAKRTPYEWRSFHVGERVRVRLSPECEFCNPWEDGKLGTVVALDHGGPGLDSYVLVSHHITVRADNPDPRDVGDPYFAAAELEPLDGAL